MSNRFTQSDLNKLASRGMRVTIAPTSKTRTIIPRVDSKQVQWMHWNLQYWCNEHALTLHKEYIFYPGRLYRFDFFIQTPNHKIGIEFNGIMSEKSRHTTITGYSGDMEKINAAQRLGYMVLQYTVLNYRNVLQDLNKML